ncbi:MAG: hypothetical protein LBR26_14210 [Prevotella sp.]|nr:hypothetical protein [Prevotella sp.]
MNTISLEARKRLIAEGISMVDDVSVIEKIEKVLKSFSPKVKRFTVEELEARIQKSERDIMSGRIHTADEVRKHLGL